MSEGIPVIHNYGVTAGEVTGHALQSEPFLKVIIDSGASAGAIETQLVGDYNLPNVLAAVTVGKSFRISDKLIREAIEAYHPSNNRSQLMELNGNHFILDAYNANPSSMRAAIDNFARLHAEDKVLMLGAMAELGEESLDEHRAIVSFIEKFNWKSVVLVGGDFRKIKHPFIQLENSAEARDWFRGQTFNNTYLLIKGSRSMQMEKVLQ